VYRRYQNLGDGAILGIQRCNNVFKIRNKPIRFFFHRLSDHHPAESDEQFCRRFRLHVRYSISDHYCWSNYYKIIKVVGRGEETTEKNNHVCCKQSLVHASITYNHMHQDMHHRKGIK
jgi:hypothetical protein